MGGRATSRQPALVISWKGDADNKDYWKGVVKAPKQIKGTFAGNAKAKSLAFTADDGSKALLAEYLKMKDNALSIALWNLIGPEGNLLSINGNPLSRRTLSDEKWVLASWDVTRILVTDKALFDVAPLGKTVLVTVGNHKSHKLPNGLGKPPRVSPSRSRSSASWPRRRWRTTRTGPTTASDCVADVMLQGARRLSWPWRISSSSTPTSASEKDVAKKQKIIEQVNARADKFQVDAEKAVLEVGDEAVDQAAGGEGRLPRLPDRHDGEDHQGRGHPGAERHGGRHRRHHRRRRDPGPGRDHQGRPRDRGHHLHRLPRRRRARATS